MLFNSFDFIFGFLPVALMAFYASGRWLGARAAAVVLSLASLIFYAWFRPRDVPILLFAIVFNYLMGQVIQRARRLDRPAHAKALLVIGLVVDLSLLGYYKYANFVVDNVTAVTGSDYTLHHIVLPLAISFFTFQKIAYLVDSARGVVSGTGPVEFGLFASFFPQLLAGPIVHYSEIIPQLRSPTFSRLMTRNLVIGLVIFAIGLAKKTVIADTLAGYADPLYLHAAGQTWDLGRGWTAAVTYALQLYMDFSGYSDMAIGLARMFGVKLPLNFHSPLRAASIIDYWRRWHMTLQRFLLAYVYQPIALPMNRWSAGRGLTGWSAFTAGVAVPTVGTFLLSGIWHGAGWTFVLFGLIHAVYVLINEIWRERRKLINRRRRKAKLAPIVIGRWEIIGYHALTLFALGFTNVMFRATSVADAWAISRAMLGFDGIGTAGYALPVNLGVILAATMFVVALFPNTQQIMEKFRPAVNAALWTGTHQPPLMWRWRPDAKGIVFAGLVLFIAVIFIQRGQAVFLYFNF